MQDDVDRSDPATRRQLLQGAAAAGLGLTSVVLPTAQAAASLVVESTPQVGTTTVTATSLGYGDSGTTGRLELNWTAVEGAASYTVHVRTGSDEFVAQAPTAATSLTLTDLAAGVDHDVYVVVTPTDAELAASQSATITANSSIVTGGTFTTLRVVSDGTFDYGINAFTFDGGDATTDGDQTYTGHDLVIRGSLAVEHLIVAGGGGGGHESAGGGGAGGLLCSDTLTRFDGTVISGPGPVTRSAATYPVRVGAGGSGGTSAQGGDGSDSSVFELTAVGGGGGGGLATKAGRAGGSGGGGAGSGGPSGTGGAGGAATTGQGTAGSAGINTGDAGGAGGGAGESGRATAGPDGAADGGDGLLINLIDTTVAGTLGIGEVWAGGLYDGASRGAGVWFAGGGGAGANASDDNLGIGKGGLGGGGDGTSSRVIAAGQDGTPNTGGGGGGPWGERNGGAGGSGVVLVRYLLPVWAQPD